MRAVFFIIMAAAMFFGFLHLFVSTAGNYSFERLHIFLFNLCAGGTLILCRTAGTWSFAWNTSLFLIMAIIYSILAFLHIYPPVIIISVFMLFIVEHERWKRFSPFPKNFFSTASGASEKFHHAALLCLSMGLIISALVIINNEFYRVVYFKKLVLNTFFLGFSFPVSLITMSVMFSFIEGKGENKRNLLKNSAFWTVNMGVIIFFIFILLEKFMPQLVVTLILFASVTSIFIIFIRHASGDQEKAFLTSGMVFLLFAAVTGILYIIFGFLSYNNMYPFNDALMKFILKTHAFASLYGWNLSGMAVIARRENFPIKLNFSRVIIHHWFTVIVLAPIGYYNPVAAVFAFLSYVVLLGNIFFSPGNSKKSA